MIRKTAEKTFRIKEKVTGISFCKKPCISPHFYRISNSRKGHGMDVFKNSEWIIADVNGKDIADSAFIYRESFDLTSTENCRLYLSSYSQYAAYINGKFVDCGQYCGYEDYQVYDILNISPFVREGKNTLHIRHYVSGEDFSTCRKQIPGVIFSVYSDENCVLNSSCDCLSVKDTRVLGLKEIISPQLGFNLDFDATKELGEFKPSVAAGKKKCLFPRPIKKLINADRVSGKLIARGTFKDGDRSLPKAERMQFAALNVIDGTGFSDRGHGGVSWNIDRESGCDGAYLLYDCDESAGLISFSFDIPRECEILIGFGEHLDDGRVRTAVGGRNFCLRYLAHAGENEFFYPLLRVGLRYLSFHIYSLSGTVNYAGLIRQTYPLTKICPDFSNELHRRIYDVGCNTLELCMHEHYEDCPWREQSLYAMDSRVQILCGYYAFREFEFPAATLRLMARSLRPDGLLELCPPGKVPVDIPSFTAVYVREVLEYTLFSGDVSVARDVFSVLEKIVQGFAGRITENGLLYRYEGVGYWNFYEWRDGLAGESVGTSPILDSPLNAFVCDAFFCFAQICKILHREGDGAVYAELNEKMKASLHKTFWNETFQAYGTVAGGIPEHALTQGLMLYIGAVPEEKIGAVAQSITSKKLIPCSLSMTIYEYEALLNVSENYKQFVLSDIENTWGKMLDAGCQTFWETEEGADAFGKAGSLCHGWSAVPIYIFGKYFNML